jgi:hypothetical protein
MADEKTITFDSVLNQLTKEAEKVTDILNITSERIITLEKNLQALKVNFKYEMPVKDPNAPDWIISWEIDEKMNPAKFRVFYSNLKENYRKPAIESKLEIRLLLARHMVPFMNSLGNFIKTKHEEVINKEI